MINECQKREKHWKFENLACISSKGKLPKYTILIIIIIIGLINDFV